MGQAYEFNGELFTNVEEFLEALAHEYSRKNGDKNLVVQTLEEYGLALTDINVRPEGV